jgi:hypothetical protein
VADPDPEIPSEVVDLYLAEFERDLTPAESEVVATIARAELRQVLEILRRSPGSAT